MEKNKFRINSSTWLRPSRKCNKPSDGVLQTISRRWKKRFI